MLIIIDIDHEIVDYRQSRYAAPGAYVPSAHMAFGCFVIAVQYAMAGIFDKYTNYEGI